MDAKIVCIDQTKLSVQVEPRAAWFPRGERAAVELSGQRDWTCLLGAITDEGERYFCKIDEYITADHAKHFILAVKERFDEDVMIVLDGAPYFQAAKVSKLAERDGLSFIQFPAYSPDLNPVEECWRQLKEVIGNRLLTSRTELKAAIDSALPEVSIPKVGNYF